eukprot:Gb_03235 [translate_table: standard]
MSFRVQPVGEMQEKMPLYVCCYYSIVSVISNYVYMRPDVCDPGQYKYDLPVFNRCNGVRVFNVPLNNYTTDSTVSVAFFELLGVLDKLKGVTVDYISSPCVLQYIREGKIKSIDASDPLQTLGFDAVFTSLIPKSQTTHCSNISFDSTFDPGPLKRAEWIKFVGAFFNHEERANQIFETIKDNYNCLKSGIANVTDKPMVAWLSYYEFIVDAGGLNIEKAELSQTFNISKQEDVESFHNILSRLSVVIDETYAPNPNEYTLHDFIKAAKILEPQSFSFLKYNGVWRFDKRVGNTYGLDWFEGAIAQPQIVLKDLIQAFHPSNGLNYNDRSTFYARNIALGEGVVDTTVLECSHTMTSPLQPTTIACSS